MSIDFLVHVEWTPKTFWALLPAINLNFGSGDFEFEWLCFSMYVGRHRVYDVTGDLDVKVSPIDGFLERIGLNHGLEDSYFIVSQVSRDDLRSEGYDSEGVSDVTMQEIANKMGSFYTESGNYWSDLSLACEQLGIKQIRKSERDE